MFRVLQVVGIFAVLPLSVFLFVSLVTGSFRAGWRYTRMWLIVVGAMAAIAVLLSAGTLLTA
jgi:hypothetical protein